MKLVHVAHRRAAGFTLVEMAIVLAIVALLLGGLIPTISSQMERQRRNETRTQMDEIKQALNGYAIINGTLPCPTTTADPSNANYGVADATCPLAGAASDGYLPWKTLGVAETDAWGSKRNSTGDPWTGYWRYRVDRNFATTFTLGAVFSADALVIKDSNGNNLTTTTERPIAIVFSTGPNVSADAQNASFEPTGGIYQSDAPSPAFDDMVIWISRPQLFNRMVMAGKLP